MIGTLAKSKYLVQNYVSISIKWITMISEPKRNMHVHVYTRACLTVCLNPFSFFIMHKNTQLLWRYINIFSPKTFLHMTEQTQCKRADNKYYPLKFCRNTNKTSDCQNVWVSWEGLTPVGKICTWQRGDSVVWGWRWPSLTWAPTLDASQGLRP